MKAGRVRDIKLNKKNKILLAINLFGIDWALSLIFNSYFIFVESGVKRKLVPGCLMPGYVRPNLRIKTSVSLNYAAIFRYVGVNRAQTKSNFVQLTGKNYLQSIIYSKKSQFSQSL